MGSAISEDQDEPEGNRASTAAGTTPPTAPTAGSPR